MQLHIFWWNLRLGFSKIHHRSCLLVCEMLLSLPLSFRIFVPTKKRRGVDVSILYFAVSAVGSISLRISARRWCGRWCLVGRSSCFETRTSRSSIGNMPEISAILKCMGKCRKAHDFEPWNDVSYLSWEELKPALMGRQLQNEAFSSSYFFAEAVWEPWWELWGNGYLLQDKASNPCKNNAISVW